MKPKSGGTEKSKWNKVIIKILAIEMVVSLESLLDCFLRYTRGGSHCFMSRSNSTKRKGLLNGIKAKKH